MADHDAQRAYLEQIEDASLMIPELLMEDLEKVFLRRISHTPGDPYTTAYLDGERAMIIHLRALQASARARRMRRQEE